MTSMSLFLHCSTGERNYFITHNFTLYCVQETNRIDAVDECDECESFLFGTTSLAKCATDRNPTHRSKFFTAIKLVFISLTSNSNKFVCVRETTL
jgi:hypothetical protein